MNLNSASAASLRGCAGFHQLRYLVPQRRPALSNAHQRISKGTRYRDQWFELVFDSRESLAVTMFEPALDAWLNELEEEMYGASADKPRVDLVPGSRFVI
jgi:hypothetical protein